MTTTQEFETIFQYLEIAQGAEDDDPRQEMYWEAYTNLLNTHCYTQELRDAWFEYLEEREEEAEEEETESEDEDEAPPPLYEIASETPPPYNLLPETPPPYRELPPAYIF